MLNRLLLNIAIILILPLSVVCQDIKPHQDGFLISREFAELTAARFDSLKFYKVQTEKLTAAADTCEMILRRTDNLIKSYDNQLISMASQLNIQNQIIRSFEKTEEINLGLKKQLKFETRKRKAWKAVGVTALGLFGTSLLYIAIR